MTYTIVQFQNSTTNQLADLDNDIATLAALAPIPCTISGTNALVLTQTVQGVSFPTGISSYANYMLFTGIATATSTGATTAQVGSLPVLNVYNDTRTGPVLTAGSEIRAGNAISLLYDSSLNAGAGGFHLITSTAINNTDIAVKSIRVGNNQSSTITNVQSGTAALTFTATPGWSSQDQLFTVTGLPPAIPTPGDFMQVVGPSLAATGVSFDGYVSAIGSLSSVASVATIAIRLTNSASASLASNSGVYRYCATRTVP
jgi:hypothetical protein